MKIGVFIKQVPATDARIKIADPSTGIDTSEIKWEINPYDEFAIEEALRLKDAGAASEVVLITVGDKSSEAKIREGLARGADRAVRLDDDAFAGSDPLGVARILAAAATAEGLGLVFTGKQAVDDDNSQVPAMAAEILGWPQAQVVSKLEIDDEGMRAWRNLGGGSRVVVASSLPAVVTCEKGLNEPRYASLKGIMMAKRKPIAVRGAADLGIDPGTVGAGAAVARVDNWGPPAERPAGRVLEGDNETRVKELVRLLREEVKVI